LKLPFTAYDVAVRELQRAREAIAQDSSAKPPLGELAQHILHANRKERRRLKGGDRRAKKRMSKHTYYRMIPHS